MSLQQKKKKLISLKDKLWSKSDKDFGTKQLEKLRKKGTTGYRYAMHRKQKCMINPFTRKAIKTSGAAAKALGDDTYTIQNKIDNQTLNKKEAKKLGEEIKKLKAAIKKQEKEEEEEMKRKEREEEEENREYYEWLEQRDKDKEAARLAQVIDIDFKAAERKYTIGELWNSNKLHKKYISPILREFKHGYLNTLDSDYFDQFLNQHPTEIDFDAAYKYVTESGYKISRTFFRQIMTRFFQQETDEFIFKKKANPAKKKRKRKR